MWRYSLLLNKSLDSSPFEKNIVLFFCFLYLVSHENQSASNHPVVHDRFYFPPHLIVPALG